MVISDEIYEHCTFGSKPFVPMGVFGEIAPVMTLGGISKRWMVPGWRLGWIAMTDPKGILRKKKVSYASHWLILCGKINLVNAFPFLFLLYIHLATEVFHFSDIDFWGHHNLSWHLSRPCSNRSGQYPELLFEASIHITCNWWHIKHEQGAVPQIIANTDDAFFRNAMNTMRKAAEICYQKLKGIECITCPHKPEGSMFVMVSAEYTNATLSIYGI